MAALPGRRSRAPERVYRTRIRGGFMKMRLTPPVAAQGAWLIAGRSAAGAVLLALTVSACTGGGSAVPAVLAPTPQPSAHASSSGNPGTRTPSPTGQSPSPRKTATSGASASPGKTRTTTRPTASSKPHASASATPKPTKTGPTVAPSQVGPTEHTQVPPATLYPTSAPE